MKGNQKTEKTCSGVVMEPFGAVKNITINVKNKILET